MEKLARMLTHPDPLQLAFELQEIVESKVYLRHGVRVREGDTVLDVGANVGVAAAFFAEECGAGVVHSFEPVLPIFEVLERNLRPFAACVPHPYGLGSENERTTIVFYPRNWAISGLYAEPETERAVVLRALLNRGSSEREAEAQLEGRFETEALACELRTVSQVLREWSIATVDLLKIDVEKAELDVLAGIEEADWPRIRQVVAELHLDCDEREQAARTLVEHGFEVRVEQDPTMAGTRIQMLYGVRR